MMKTFSLKTNPWTTVAVSVGLLFAVHSAIAAEPSPTQSSLPTTTQGYGPGMMGPGMMGPGMMGPGMMYSWTPAQREQYWQQMRRSGYGPGMMGPGMMGYGPGTMMGPPGASSPQTSGQ